MVFAERLPALQSLIVFEAAARHLSFTAAARELGTTQSAVSQQVRGLEEELQLELFLRVYRGVELTDEGRALHHAVEEGLHRIAGTLEQLQYRRQHQRLTVATDFAFAAYWLMPRLPDFRNRFPEVDVRIMTSQGGDGLQPKDADVAISFCGTPPNQRGARRLFAEEVFPICSPALLERLGAPQKADQLLTMPLLSLRAESGAGWLEWKDLLQHLGVEPKSDDPVLTFDNYTLLIQAALAGQGVGLGWGTLVDDLIDRGLLVALRDFTVHTRGGYFLREPRPREPVNAKRHFVHWLLETRTTEIEENDD
ncbi:MAG: LysR family transcriptional regulator [Oceanospirillaceae bacterium]|nr:LysR family transcriptional regulator [Oceanospirillaceae bacterium]